jgi:hypothetical protein
LFSSFQLSAKQPGIGPFGCSSFISLLELESPSPYSGSPISFSIALPIAIIAIAVAVFRLLQVIYIIFAITTFPPV